MSYSEQISPGALRDYAKAKGWTPLIEGQAQRLYVLKSPKDDYRQIVVPMDSNRCDFEDAVRLAIHTLSEVEDKPINLIEYGIRRFREFRRDRILLQKGNRSSTHTHLNETEAWLLTEWRSLVARHRSTQERQHRDRLATAIRAIRSARTALQKRERWEVEMSSPECYSCGFYPCMCDQQ